MRWPWRPAHQPDPPGAAELGLGEIEHKAVLDSYYRTLARLGGGLGAPSGPWPVERAVAEGYERVIWVFKAVDTIARNSAKLPYRLREGEKTVKDHPLYRVLNQRANPMETGQQFRKRLSAQVSLSPRGAFVEVTKSRGGTVLRYDLLPPGRTYPVPGYEPGVLLDHFEVQDPRTGRRRGLDPNKVRWIRDPHPIDPYLGITPLEAMGMSVELDFFARLYNVSFLRNDGRPGGVLGVESDMDEPDMDRVERKLGRGPVEAGKITVLGGKLSYVDTAARPRDMAYSALSKSAKEEILGGFGVDESVMGLTANRTYDNAEQAEYNFWSITMDAHNSLITSGLDEDSEDELEGFFDTSKIEALELPARKRREEARAEFTAGLRSIFSYAQLAGIDGIEDTAHTRALYLPAGSTPLAAREADEEALAPPAPPTPPPDRGGPPPEQPPGELDQVDQTDPFAILGSVAASQPAPALNGRSAKLHLVPDLEPVGRPVTEHKADPQKAPDRSQDEASAETDSQARDKAEIALAAVLAAWAARRVAVTTARVKSPKVRKGTRHWTAGDDTDTRGGDQPLDAQNVVGPDQWSAEASAAAEPVLRDAAMRAAEHVATALGADRPDDDTIADQVATAVAASLAMVTAGALRQAQTMVQLVQGADTSGQGMDAITAAVQGQSAGLTRWADSVSIQAITALVEGVQAAVYGVARVAGLTKVWITRHDDRVRASHRAADGQRQPPGQPFEVGGALLRYPGDPLAPLRETAGCRCKTRWAWRRAELPMVAEGAG